MKHTRYFATVIFSALVCIASFIGFINNGYFLILHVFGSLLVLSVVFLTSGKILKSTPALQKGILRSVLLYVTWTYAGFLVLCSIAMFGIGIFFSNHNDAAAGWTIIWYGIGTALYGFVVCWYLLTSARVQE
jgi:hypothetical protein